MLQSRRQAADHVSAKLFRAETALSQALVEVAGLVDVTETARTSANLSMVVGSDPAAHTIQCLAALGSAREALVRAHQGFAATHKSLGLGAVATGAGGGDKPDQIAPSGQLSIVAA